MVFKGKKELDGNWTAIAYQTTWPMFYELMLCAVEELLEYDFKDKLGRIAFRDMASATECLEEVKLNGLDIRKCADLCNEHASIIVSGVSRIMECPIQFELYNQVDQCTIAVPTKTVETLFEKYGNDVFTNYMNSIEIKSHVKYTLQSRGVGSSASTTAMF